MYWTLDAVGTRAGLAIIDHVESVSKVALSTSPCSTSEAISCGAADSHIIHQTKSWECYWALPGCGCSTTQASFLAQLCSSLILACTILSSCRALAVDDDVSARTGQALILAKTALTELAARSTCLSGHYSKESFIANLACISCTTDSAISNGAVVAGSQPSHSSWLATACTPIPESISVRADCGQLTLICGVQVVAVNTLDASGAAGCTASLAVSHWTADQTSLARGRNLSVVSAVCTD